VWRGCFSSLRAARFKEGPTATPTRRAVLKGTAAFAGLAAVQTSGLAPAAEAAPAGTGSGRPKANVLLVHGA
jgi:nitrous oxide reductase